MQKDSLLKVCRKDNKKMIIQQIIYLLAFFFIYSFLGWVLESVVKTVSQKKLVNSGFLYGPFCPIYGIGAIRNDTYIKFVPRKLRFNFYYKFFCILNMGIFCGVATREAFSRKILGLYIL